MMVDNTLRFSDRVDNYVKYRPSYPTEILQFLETTIGFDKDFVVADVGSGTGIFTEIFLKNKNIVLAVEPNEPMRNKAEELLKDYSNFKSINGTAEQTNLAADYIDLIIAAQAFHWFDIIKTKKEFKRILKPNGYCCLIWNERLNESAFAKAYDNLLLEYSTDYAKVDHKNIDEKKIAVFYAPQQFVLKSFSNKQVFNFESLKGRLLSSSYTPDKNQPNYKPMIAQLENIFNSFQQDNTVQFDYTTKVYVGKL